VENNPERKRHRAKTGRALSVEPFTEITLDLNQWADLTRAQDELLARLRSIDETLAAIGLAVNYSTETLAEVISDCSLNISASLKKS